MSDDTTVTFHVPGMEPVTTTMAELDRAARGLTHNRKEPAMAEGATVQNLHEQLTFDVSTRYKRPDEASITLTGAGALTRELYLGDTVTVRVTNARGEIISEAHGHVVDLAFKVHPEKLDKDGLQKEAEFVERKHKVKLGDEDQ